MPAHVWFGLDDDSVVANPLGALAQEQSDDGFVQVQVPPRPCEGGRPACDPFEELTQPQPPKAALLSELEGEQPAARRSQLPARSASAMLNGHLECIGAEIDGQQPFVIKEGLKATKPAKTLVAASDVSSDDDDDDDDEGPEMILHKEKDCKLRERHDRLCCHQPWVDSASPLTAYEGYKMQLEDGRVLLDERVVLDGEEKMARGQKLEYVGSTDGCPLGAIARHQLGADDDCQKEKVIDELVQWLEDRTEDFVFYGRRLDEWVAWERLPIKTRAWVELIDWLRAKAHYLTHTGADWLLLIATAHVYAPVVVLHYRLARAVRFVKADAQSGEGEAAARGHVAAAQLPASGASWLRLGMLEQGHLVRCRSKQLTSAVMLKMADERDELLARQTTGQLGPDQIFETLKAHAANYETANVKYPSSRITSELASVGGNLDAAIEKLGLPPRSAPDAVMLQGPSKAGKSTLLNGLLGKTLYDNTPPERQGDDMCEPALAVLGKELKGSQIGKDAESETLHVNPVVIKTDDEDTPYLQVLDTPGMFDTRGPLVEVVNALSIAKYMVQFKTLRIVVMVRGTALEGTGDGFADTARTMQDLFSNAGGAVAVKKNLLLWVNPHAPAAKYNANGVIEKIKKIKGARPAISDFLKMVVSQQKSRTVVRVLEYDTEDATGSNREQIIAERLRSFPQLDSETATATMAVFPRDELIESIVSLPCMRNPADKCGLPLTPKAVAEIERQASELVDFVNLHGELKDYAAVAHDLDVLHRLCTHMRCGAADASHKEHNCFEAAYGAALGVTLDRLYFTCSKAKMAELCRPLEGRVTAADLNALSLHVRAAAAATVLETHLGDKLKELTAGRCAEVVVGALKRLCNASRVLLQDHFIAGSSGATAAHSLFGERLRLTLSTLQQLGLHFEFEAHIADGASAPVEKAMAEGEKAAFSAIVAAADECLKHLRETVELAIETQTSRAKDKISHALAEAAIAAAECRKSLSARCSAPSADSPPLGSLWETTLAVPPAHPASNPFDAAAEALGVVRIAEEALVSLVPSLRGTYAASRDAAVEVVLQRKSEVSTAIGEMRQETLQLPKEMAAARGTALEGVLAKLLFLLHARSSRLRSHFGADEAGGLAALDGCYEEPVGAVVAWHTELVREVLEASKGDLDAFACTISDFQPQIELSEQLARLAHAESLPLYAGAQLSRGWQQLNDSWIRLTSRIESTLSNYVSSVGARLKAHAEAVVRGGEGARQSLEEYDYAAHAKDLELLENARWCDALLHESIIEPAVVRVSDAFEQHITHLAKGPGGSGPGGAVDRLRTGDHAEARSLLVQIHNMLALCAPFPAGTDFAARIRAVHDETEAAANALIVERCEKARSKVLNRAGPLGESQPWDWWLELSVRDANVVDALSHLNGLLDLDKWLVASGQLNALSGWLQLDELERVAIECRNRATEFLMRVRTRASLFFSAVGGCVTSEMDQAVASLIKGCASGPAAIESEAASQASDDDPAAMPRNAKQDTWAAVRELKEILSMLSRPEKLDAIFEAARDPDSDPDGGLDLTLFRDLSRQYQESLSDASGNFHEAATEPRARKQALFAYSAFNKELPPSKAFEDFKRTFQASFPSLQKADADARKETSKELHKRIAQHDFSEATRDMLLSEQAMGRLGEREYKAYVDLCNVLVGELKILLFSFMTSTPYLRFPDQSFNVQKDLVEPWNQLQAAHVNMSEFLSESSAKEAFDLGSEVAAALQIFEQAWRDEVAKYARMWDMGYYADAEGSSTRGLMRLKILEHGLATARGGDLGRIAKQAYDEERARQRTELERVHTWRPELLPVAKMEADDSFDEQARTLVTYFDKAFARFTAMRTVTFCELASDYLEAAKRINDVFVGIIKELFSPLVDDSFLDLSPEHVNFLDGLLGRMMGAPYKDLVPTLLPLPSTGGNAVESMRANITTFRWHKESADMGAFSVMTPEDGDSVDAVRVKIQQQAEVLRRTKASNRNFVKFVNHFKEAFAASVQRTTDLLRAIRANREIPPGALDAAFAELRGRKEAAAGVQGVILDLVAVATLEQEAAVLRIKMKQLLESSPQSPLAPAKSYGDDTAKDAKLLPMMQVYTSLVRVAPMSAGVGSIPAAPPILEPTADRVLHLLLARLNETLSQLHDKASSPREIALKQAALLRLQQWEPPPEACASSQLGGAQLCIFGLAGKLQAALLAEGSLSPPQMAVPSPPPQHEERRQRLFDEFDALIAVCTEELGRANTFNWKVDAPLDPKSFELLFSEPMANLMLYVIPGLKPKVEELKVAVGMAAGGLPEQVQALMKKPKNWADANAVLERWKFFEPLVQLGAFKTLPGPEAFDRHLEKQLEELKSKALSKVSLTTKETGWQKHLCGAVLKIWKFKDLIPRSAELATEALGEVLDAIELKFGSPDMMQLAQELRERDGALGQEIVSASSAFEYVTVADFNRKTTRATAEVRRLYAERNQGDGDDTNVWARYDIFEAEYSRLLSHALPTGLDDDDLPDDPLQWLIESTKTAVRADTGYVGQARRMVAAAMPNLYESKASVPKVLAGIFAWWSVAFFEKLRKKNPRLRADLEKLRRPNSVQVVCILRLLGGTDKLRNHLAEVPTGEGKSVILGVLATTLALYDFQVDCVCYSSMLSTRDCQAFVPMFEAFGLGEKIRYGTFESLCEQLLTAQYGDLRKATREFLACGHSSLHRSPKASKRVLIIDEVDVFCSEAFFGGAFSPILAIQNDAVAALMRHIWSLRSAPSSLASIKAHPTYRAVLDSGVLQDQREWLLERAVREMDQATRSYSPKKYDHTVRGGKILYKVAGRDEYGPWSYLYDTNAEYLAAFDRCELSEQQLTDGLAVHVRCGEFSYAKLPAMFKHILGVTGTLDASRLPPQMHDVLRQEVGIEAFTFCPSMFPAQKRDFKADRPADVQVAKDEHEHFHLLVDEIDKRLLPTTDMEAKRSILVFFRDAAELTAFYESSYFAKHKAGAKVLTELTAASACQRDNIITSATRQGQVTLATRIYARGTDFKINDMRMEQAGGVHVISSYFSRDLSEEVQMMGRCARQGAPGSFSMVILSKSELDVEVATVEGWAPEKVHAELSALRAAAGAAEVKALREMAAQRLAEHEVLATSLKEFGRGATGGLERLMRRYNSPGGLVVGPNGIHVVLCLDESGSMSGAPWAELVAAFEAFWATTAAAPASAMFASVVQFGSHVRTTINMRPIQGAAPRLSYQSSGTRFLPPVQQAKALIDAHGPGGGYTTVVVFMSDGGAGDATSAAGVLQGMAQRWPGQFESHAVGFGHGAATTLEQMAFAHGELDKNKYTKAAVGNLAESFTAIAKSIAPGRL